jgi:hypothetical protein
MERASKERTGLWFEKGGYEAAARKETVHV